MKKYFTLFLICQVMQIPLLVCRIYNLIDITTLIAILLGLCWVAYIYYINLNDAVKTSLRSELKETETAFYTQADRVAELVSEKHVLYKKLTDISSAVNNSCESVDYETDKQKVNAVKELLTNKTYVYEN